MKLKLMNILESTILVEGRLEDVKAKYQGNDKLIDALSKTDPSGNNKYLDWMTKQVLGLGDGHTPTTDIVIDTIELFDKSGARLKKAGKPSDINQYKSVWEIKETIDSLSRREAPSKAQLKGLGELVLDNENLYVIAPRNWEGSCKFGTGAKWCIAQETSSSHWTSYSKGNMFYFVVSKKLPSSDNNYKIAIQKDLTTGKNTYWDVPDTSSNTPQNRDIDASVLSVIDKHFNKTKKLIFERLISDMVNGVSSQLTSDNLKRVIDIVKPEELYKIIEQDIKIITSRSGDDVFNKIVNTLGDDKLLKLLTSDYESLSSLLVDDKILNFLDTVTGRESKLKLSQNLKPYLKNMSSNIRVKIQKWSMTDADWEDYNNNSSYIYVGKTDTKKPVSEIYVIDRFDIKSHEKVSQLKLKLKYEGVSLFGVKTSKGLLDDYLEDGDIPDELLNKINPSIIR